MGHQDNLTMLIFHVFAPSNSMKTVYLYTAKTKKWKITPTVLIVILSRYTPLVLFNNYLLSLVLNKTTPNWVIDQALLSS